MTTVEASPVQQPELVHLAESESSSEAALLTANDLVWLNKLSTEEIAEEDLAVINELVISDVPHMRHEGDKRARGDAQNARTLFYEDILGWDNEDSPYHSSYGLMKADLDSGYDIGRPLAGFIMTLRELDELQLDIRKVAEGYPAVLARSATHLSLAERAELLMSMNQTGDSIATLPIVVRQSSDVQSTGHTASEIDPASGTSSMETISISRSGKDGQLEHFTLSISPEHLAALLRAASHEDKTA